MAEGMKIVCHQCGKKVEKSTGHVNRARKLGLNLFCDRKCAGLGRRVYRSDKEKREIKRLYDACLRQDPFTSAKRKEQAQAYNSSPAGRAMQKRNREKFKQSHLEYCRTPEYRKWKQQYDEKHRARKMYGEFWESAIAVKNIQEITRPEKYQIRLENGTFNKSQKRKRAWNSLQQTLKKHYGKP